MTAAKLTGLANVTLFPTDHQGKSKALARRLGDLWASDDISANSLQCPYTFGQDNFT